MRKWWKRVFLLLVLFGVFPVRAAAQEPGGYKAPDIFCPLADGDNGYYRTPPQIQIHHQEERAVLYYRLCAEGRTLAEGVLEHTESGVAKDTFVTLSGTLLREGVNTLEVWMEDDSARVFYEKRELLVDTIPPEGVQFFYDAAQETDGVYAPGESCRMTVTCSDSGSGVKEICYKIREREEKTLPGAYGEIVIMPYFKGRVEAYAVDVAGNQSDWTSSREILCQEKVPQPPLVPGDGSGRKETDKEITQDKKQENGQKKEQKEKQETKKKEEEKEEEKKEKEEKETEKEGEKKKEKKETEKKTEKAQERKEPSGVEEAREAKKEVLQIRYVDQLNNSRVPYFVWNYEPKELIRGMEGYTCRILLDGKQYILGTRVEKKGTHTLKIQAVDPSGDQTEKRAVFYIEPEEDTFFPFALGVCVFAVAIYSIFRKSRKRSKRGEHLGQN